MQAHLVAACANLRLATFHPSENISELGSLYDLINKALTLLDARDDSDIATRGARWLRSPTMNAKAKDNVCSQRTLRNEVAEWPLRSDLKNESSYYSQNSGTTSHDLSRVPPEGFESWTGDAVPELPESDEYFNSFIDPSWVAFLTDNSRDQTETLLL